MMIIENKFKRGDIVYYLGDHTEANISRDCYPQYFLELDTAKYHEYRIISIIVNELDGDRYYISYRLNNAQYINKIGGTKECIGYKEFEVNEGLLFSDWEKCYMDFVNSYLSTAEYVKKKFKEAKKPVLRVVK